MRTIGLATVVVGLLSGCGDSYQDEPDYRGTPFPAAVGAYSIDRLLPTDEEMLGAVDNASRSDMVVLFYGHNPGVRASFETIDALLTRADSDGLPALSFAELAEGPPRAGICLSFDDTEVEAWSALEPLLEKHHAHVSFFVTRYASFTPAQRALLHDLYAHHHSIEAHGVNHAYANDYIPRHGLDAYLKKEVLPSIEALRADGFAPVAYAHPGGSHTDELDDAIGEHIQFVRGTNAFPRKPKR